MSDTSYIVKVKNKIHGEVLVGPFSDKLEARKYLLDNTGSATGGLVMLMFAPRTVKD